MGQTHDTAGSVPALAAVMKSARSRTLPSSLSVCTVVKYGSGFQIPGVAAFCFAVGVAISSASAVSGSVPEKT